jgi:hypothetical protein
VQVCEFRSRQLVGLAAMDLNQRDLILCQYGDNQTYATTAMWVHHFLPREVTNQMRGAGLSWAGQLERASHSQQRTGGSELSGTFFVSAASAAG